MTPRVRSLVPAHVAHGRARELGGTVVIEAPPADEMVARVTGSAAPPARAPQGRFLPGESARLAGASGGRKRAGNVRLAASLGLRSLAESPGFAPYAGDAAAFVDVEVKRIALAFGGECGPAPSSVVQSAGLQLAASRYLFDLAAKANDPALFLSASRLAAESRQSLVVAMHLAEIDHKARAATRTERNPFLVPE